MVELVARFEDVFKALNYNKDTVCELFKRFQDLVISCASDIEKKLNHKAVDLCTWEGIIVKVLPSPMVWLTPEEELKFYAQAHTLITEAINDLENHCYWLVRSGMAELVELCKSASK